MRSLCWLALFASMCAIGSAQQAHYLDCSAGRTAGDSLKPETAWTNIEQANANTFQPGDSLLLRRGSRCTGMLTPRGSGSSNAPIKIGAYGDGPLPVLDAGGKTAALQLWNQQYWEIENLELSGGSQFGLYVGADTASVHHIHVRNLVVHGVNGELKAKESGLIVMAPAQNSPATINDVLVDGVTAYDTTQWAGIVIEGASYNEREHHYGDNIVVRNSIVHDVAGDGILLMSVRNGVIEHNVAWNTGMQESETIGTPNAIWEWMCIDCRVAWNEGFFSDSPGVDGGIFDIDYGNVNNIVEHNFAHDSQGYCAAIFAAEGEAGASTNSIVRYNTCLHNGRSPRLARRQGALFVYTWHGGKLDGISFERNTVLWNPPVDAPAIRVNGEFTGSLPNSIADNRIVLAGGSALQSQKEVEVKNNLVCAAQTASSTSANSSGQRTQPLCSCWMEWRNQLNREARTPIAISAGLAKQGKGWRLVAGIDLTQNAIESRNRIVLLESMLHQFGRFGLSGILVPPTALRNGEADRLRSDWHLSSGIQIAAIGSQAIASGKTQPQLLLLRPDSSVAAHWPLPVDSAQVWLELEESLGTPTGMQPTPVCKAVP